MTGPQKLAPGELRAHVISLEGTIHVLVRGELDAHTCDSLWATCRGAAAELPDHGVLVVDLSALDFIDAAGLGLLVRLGDHLGSTGKSLQIEAPCPAIRRVFALAQLERLLASGTPAPPEHRTPAPN